VPLACTGGEGWLAHVLPLTAGARREAGITHAAAAAVFVRKASLESSPSAMETIGKVYKLTPSELRVLQAVVEVGGSPAVADALGISESTVKTHLKSVFEKTSTHRQADLVKLVAGAASPFVN
jgi:DNA-binding CsgD family transcriptional regulator